jgi:hypothetical protein
MYNDPTMPNKITLPLLSEAPPSPASWEGMTVLGPLPDAPEPISPQGAYNPIAPEAPLSVPLVPATALRQTELLAPAGGLNAGASSSPSTR